jgi:hypothetical protein
MLSSFPWILTKEKMHFFEKHETRRGKLLTLHHKTMSSIRRSVTSKPSINKLRSAMRKWFGFLSSRKRSMKHPNAQVAYYTDQQEHQYHYRDLWHEGYNHDDLRHEAYNYDDSLYDDASPLAVELQAMPWPSLYKPPQLPMYDDHLDPKQFLMSYEATISSYGWIHEGKQWFSPKKGRSPKICRDE